MEKAPKPSKNTIKGELTQCMDSFIEVAKSLIGSRTMTTPTEELRYSIKAAVDILNNTEGVEVGHLFG